MTSLAEPRWAQPDAQPVRAPAPRALRRRTHVGYVMSRFPRLTETFIVTEIEAMQRQGASISVHPLHHERAAVTQPRAAALAPLVDARHATAPGAFGGFARAFGRTPARVGATAGAVLEPNLRSRRLLAGAAAALPYAVDLARRAERLGIDHLHCHFATHPAVVGYVVHRLTGIPFSFTAHGSDLHRDQAMLAEKVEAAAFVVTVSDWNRRFIVDVCGPDAEEKVEVIRCGIDPAAFPARPATGREPGPFRLLCTGTLHEVKGQTHLVDACAELVARGADIHAVLIGDGPDRGALEAQIRARGLEGIVELAGALPQPEVRDHLRRADVVVVPSVPSADGRREGLPTVVGEAMSVGVPVVASRLSGIPEVVHDGRTGLLVEPGDVYHLACAIGRLVAEPGLGPSLVAHGHRLVARELRPDRSARQLLRAIEGGSA